MSDFPAVYDIQGYYSSRVISPHSRLSIGSSLPSSTAVAWPSANRALFSPFRIVYPETVYQIGVYWGNAATGSHNFDVGIYDQYGNRIVSSGATACAASTAVFANITDTRLLPGLYYMALAADSGTPNPFGVAMAQVAMVQGLGQRQMDSAYTLPATATFAQCASTFLLTSIGLWLRSE